MKASISASDIPLLLSRARNRRFSSNTFRAAACISAEASTPSCSHVRYFVSSSWRYSFLRARERRWLSRIRAKLAFYDVLCEYMRPLCPLRWGNTYR
jgi:hypothetical protein